MTQNLSDSESNFKDYSEDNHLSSKFNNYTHLRFTTFSFFTETKSYTPINSCVFEHILTTINLTNTEKLYYILADSLALIAKNKGNARSCALPSEDWAKYLGCSRSLIFTMQKSLEQKGYFIINKDFDHIGRNKRNLITPTLPNQVFHNLNENFPNIVGEHLPYDPLTECKRSYLDRTKLFLKLNYKLLKIITANIYLNPIQKILWLSFYCRCYKNHMLDKYNSSFSFISSYNEIAQQHSYNSKHISKSLKNLEDIGFIKTQNIYVRKKINDDTDNKIQERQDKSLWKITVSLPEDSISELDKEKDRSSLILSDIKVTSDMEKFNSNIIDNFLILEGIKFDLTPQQSGVIKSLITCSNNKNSSDINYKDSLDLMSSIPYTLSDQSHTDSIIAELSINDSENDKLEEFYKVNDSKFSSNVSQTSTISSSLETISNKAKESNGIKSDPHFAKSRLLLNKDILLKIKYFKSNLEENSKVIFNDFLKKLNLENNIDDISSSKQKWNNYKNQKFNVCSELIRNKLKELPKDKADKARKFAYSLLSKKLAKGYASSLSKSELAKQLIHHISKWKPTKLGSISREQEIDTALSVAWKSITSGTWQAPLEWVKAELLNYEYLLYLKKYKESGIISYEVRTLEIAVNKLLGGYYDLEDKIKSSVISEFDYDKKSDKELCKAQDEILYSSKDMFLKSDYCKNAFETELSEDDMGESNIRDSVDFSNLSDRQKHIVLEGTDFDKNRIKEDLSDILTGSCKNDISDMKEKTRGFIGIDKALAGIMNNLSCRY